MEPQLPWPLMIQGSSQPPRRFLGVHARLAHSIGDVIADGKNGFMNLAKLHNIVPGEAPLRLPCCSRQTAHGPTPLRASSSCASASPGPLARRSPHAGVPLCGGTPRQGSCTRSPATRLCITLAEFRFKVRRITVLSAVVFESIGISMGQKTVNAGVAHYGEAHP